MSNRKPIRKMMQYEKQTLPLPGETAPEDAFIKSAIAARRAANKYGVKNINLDQSEEGK